MIGEYIVEEEVWKLFVNNKEESNLDTDIVIYTGSVCSELFPLWTI